MSDRSANTLLDELQLNGTINKDGLYFIPQTNDGNDLEDRIKLLEYTLSEIGQK